MEENKLALFNNGENKVFCSLVAKTEDEKKDLFNTLEKCDVLLNDCVGQEIAIKDVYCEQREIIDEESGELKTKYRTILFDENGQTYATGSYGIYNVLKKIFSIYGLPQTWENPLKVKVTKKPIGNGKQSLTLLIA